MRSSEQGRQSQEGDPLCDAPSPANAPEASALVLVLTTLPDEASARRIASQLVQERLAACVSILAGCTSVYRWQGAIEVATERPILLKTAADRYPALQARLRELHPYELPEIVCWQPHAALSEYAAWVIEETRSI